MRASTGSRHWRHGVHVRERGPGESYRPDRRPATIFGAHQPGIASAHADHVSFAAFDLDLDRAVELRDLLALWSAASEREMRADRATITLGLGPGVFARNRFGVGPAPVALEELPAFPGDRLEAALCGGDVCVVAAGADAVAVREALGALEHAASGAAHVRWRQDGFLVRRAGEPAQGTPRDLLGFKHGTMNLRRGKDLDRHVWAARGERSWMQGGTYLVVRDVRLHREAWERLPVADQERVIGRRRDTGAPLGRVNEFDPLPLADEALIPPDAHSRLSSPRANGGIAMLRRGYSFIGDDGGAGLLFLAYQRDPRRQFVPVQRRLAAHDALSRFIVHVGSAVFAIPPGAPAGGFIGQQLLERAA